VEVTRAFGYKINLRLINFFYLFINFNIKLYIGRNIKAYNTIAHTPQKIPAKTIFKIILLKYTLNTISKNIVTNAFDTGGPL
jgi:hypothetical protein